MESLTEQRCVYKNPGKLFFSYLKQLFSQAKTTFTDKTKWIPLLILIVVWSISAVLSIWKISIPFLDFLISAKAGVNNGILGVIGGSIGKGLVAYFVITIVQAIVKKKNPFSSIMAGMKSFLMVFDKPKKTPWYSFLVGLGFAMILFNFMAGYATGGNGMIGIVGFVLSAQAVTKPNGFLSKFASSCCSSFQKKCGNNDSTLKIYTKTLLSGWGIGFGLAFVFSLFNQLFICYYIGLVAFVASIPLYFVMRKGEKNA